MSPFSALPAAALAATALLPVPAAWADLAADRAMPGRVLVRVLPAMTPEQVAALDAKAGVQKVAYTSRLVTGLRCVVVAEGGVDAAVAVYRASPGVRYANADYLRTVAAQETPWGVARIGAPQQWQMGRGSSVRVADLDTGMDLEHPDLPAPVATVSFTGEPVQDGHGHGTHTAGTIAALDNAVGVVGVAPACSLMVGKVLANGGSGADSWVAAGIDWAVENGARVINMSLGGPEDDPALRDSCDAALAAGVLVVAAAGNSGSDGFFFPARYDSVMAVAAVDSTDARASFSNFGPHISVSAPGVNVQSTYIGGGTVTWQAVPHDASVLSGSGPGPVAGPVVYCGLGNPEDFPPGGIAGKIAHIRRGTLLFVDKANNAIAAGAVGVIISNNEPGSYNGTLNTTVAVPVVGITQTDGDALEALSLSGEVSASINTVGGHAYGSLNGTSMAAPHVTGAAALLLGLRGGRYAASEVREAIEQTATDLGDSGRDDLYGYGLVNLPAAASYLLQHYPICVADIGRQGGLVGRDNLLDNNDFIAFIGAFFASDPLADVGAQGGVRAQDGALDNNDFIAFIAAFFESAGCDGLP